MLIALALLTTSLLGVAATSTGASATYPGRDGKIAFVRANQVYTMTATGGSVTRLTTTGKNYRPHWSPNGTRISYINETSSGAKDVWVMTATGASKQRVTTTGDVTSVGAVWSPNGARLAFAKPDPQTFDIPVLWTVKSTSVFGAPTKVIAPRGDQGGECAQTDPEPVYVDRFIAWSATNVIAVLNGMDCQLDDAIYAYYPATGDYRQLDASGGDCCGYLEWTDLFYGPTGRLGRTERNLGDELESPDAPTRIRYPSSPSTPSTFISADGDTGGAPSPSGTYMALTNASSGTAQIFRANVNGSGRRLLTNGYQPDWQRVA
jgi:hypothetical protein